MDKDIEIDQDIIDLMTEGRTLEAVKALHERMDIPLKSAVYISRSIKVDGQGGYEIFDYEGPGRIQLPIATEFKESFSC